MNSTELKNGLSLFTGTENYYKHALGKMTGHDALKYSALEGGAEC